MQLELIIDRIEQAFGGAAALPGESLAAPDLAALQRLLQDEACQSYLQDQHNRQIIRDYLTNAVMLGLLREDRLAAFDDRIATEEGRSVLSLHMLMSSVEEAEALASDSVVGEAETLQPLHPAPGAPPFMKLVP